MKRKYESSSYPYIIIPEDLVAAINAKPEIPGPPKKPKVPPKPIEPLENDNSYKGCTAPFILIGILLIILAFAAEETLFLFFFVGFGGLAYLVFKPQTSSKASKEHIENYSDYLWAKKTYPQRLREFENELINYESELKEYELQIKSITSDDSKNKSRKILIDRVLERNSSAFYILRSESAKKGVAESFFSDLLLKQFGDNILFDICFKGYYPDFVYYNKSSNILINIEIDEPYVGHSGEPIHYTDGFYRVDQKRDDVFIKNGFIVLRFAEIQIFKYHIQCVSYIESLINALQTSDFSFLKENIVPNVPFWKKEKSYELGFIRFRHSYIPRSLHHLIEIKNNLE